MSRLLGALGAAAVVALLAVPVVLHFGQKAHDRLEIVYLRPAAGQPDPAPGQSFALASAAIVDRELSGTTGWRPNDVFLWGPGLWADNNSNRQLGILQALRETLRVFKDHLTKVSSDVYDQNLVSAENNLRNDPTKWAFPSAESRYREAAARLQAYVDGLGTDPPTSRPINARNVELIRLMQTWTDLLGDAHAELYRADVDWLQIDDAFYHAQGFCHVIAAMLPAVEIEYRREIDGRPVLRKLFTEAQAPLDRCAVMKPLAVVDGSDASLLANHRRNLDVYVNEARQKLYSIREELEK